MRVLLAGASGSIGRAVRSLLAERGHETMTLVRREARRPDERQWRPAVGTVPADAIAWAEGVISLSGAPLTRLPWTKAYREQILASRVASAGALAMAIAGAAPADRPAAWVSGSAVGIYGDRPGEALTEDSPRGTGYLAEVVARWEAAAGAARDATRLVTARTGVVLSAGGALRPLVLAARLGLPTVIGTGDQTWPWIALADEAAAIVHLLETSELDGPVNLVSPEGATAGAVTDAIARRLGRGLRLRVPASLAHLALGAAADDLLLADQRVVPARLAADGFAFTAPNLDGVIAAALAR